MATDPRLTIEPRRHLIANDDEKYDHDGFFRGRATNSNLLLFNEPYNEPPISGCP